MSDDSHGLLELLAGNWTAIGVPIPGLALRFESEMQSVSRFVSSRSLGWPSASAVPPFTKKQHPVLQSLVQILTIGVNCVTPRLVRIHPLLATFDNNGLCT